MNKEEFIKTLRKKLDVLENSEIEDIVSEYEGYIEEKVSRGLTEEEAVKELGDINEIVSDLLAAYKVKEPKKDININGLFNKLSNYLDRFMDSLNDKSAKDILKLIVEVFIILVIIGLFKIPFNIIKEFGYDIFNDLPYFPGKVFYGLWALIINLSYLALAILMFVKIVEKRYFKDLSEKIVDHEPATDKKPANNKKKTTEAKAKKETVAEAKQNKEVKEVKVETKEEDNFGDTLSKVCLVFLKVLASIFVIGIVGYLIGMGCAIGIMCYLIASGVKYFGVFILLIALFSGGAFVLHLVTHFIFGKKIKAWRVITKLIILVILTSIGITLSTIEIANTEVIYDKNYETSTITKEIEMDEDLALYYYDNVKIDNTLTDKVRIEYTYPKLVDSNIKIDLEKCHRGYCLKADSVHIKLSKSVVNDFIEDLKNQKIHVYEYDVKKTIYISEDNYKILKANNDM